MIKSGVGNVYLEVIEVLPKNIGELSLSVVVELVLASTVPLHDLNVFPDSVLTNRPYASTIGRMRTYAPPTASQRRKNAALIV